MNILNTLLEITVYSAIIFVMIWLFRILLKKHLSSIMMYTMWFLLIARLLLPVTISSGFSLFIVPAAETTNAPPQSEVISGQSSAETMDDFSFGQGELPGVADETILSQGQIAADTTSVQPLKRDSSFSITWETVLIVIWTAGAVAMLTAVCVSKIKLKKKLRSAKPIPKEWQQLADEIKVQLSIKNNIRIVMIKGFPSPALTASIKPTVVLPEELLLKSEDNVRFALLHEMTHIKRKDNIVSLLLLLLRSVYWFNPIVWLTVKQMHLDMESACDNTLTTSMSMQTKKRYAGTMLSMYAEKQVRYVLGMATGQTKKTAEKRLRSIFMRNKTSRKGRASALLLACVMLLACFTTACQPTPEEPAVVGKGEFEDIIAQEQTEDQEEKTPVIAEPYEAPESWTEAVDMKGSDIEVNVDADIIVPDVSSYPVYEVVKNNFTQQQIDDLMDYFVKDKVIMQAAEMTKADYQEMLIEAKRGQYIDGEYVVNEGSLEWVKEVEEMIRNAPETSEPQVVTNRSIEGDGFGGAVVLEDGKYGSVSASERTFSYCSAGYPRQESQLLEMNGTGIEGEINISQQEAVDKAQELFSELGITNMKAVDIEKAELISRTDLKFDVENPKLESRGYFIKFALSIDGIDTVLVEGGRYRKEETFEYSAPWTPEWVHVYVDENGDIGYFNWKGPLKLTEKVSENVTLKSFEDIQDRIRAQMLYECGFYEGNFDNPSILIERIEMKMTIVGVKNEPDKAMYVPAWYIYYDLIHNVDFVNDNGEHVTERTSDELMVLNAIDGGVVLPFRVPTDISNAEDLAAAEDEIAESMN